MSEKTTVKEEEAELSQEELETVSGGAGGNLCSVTYTCNICGTEKTYSRTPFLRPTCCGSPMLKK